MVGPNQRSPDSLNNRSNLAKNKRDGAFFVVRALEEAGLLEAGATAAYAGRGRMNDNRNGHGHGIGKPIDIEPIVASQTSEEEVEVQRHNSSVGVDVNGCVGTDAQLRLDYGYGRIRRRVGKRASCYGLKTGLPPVKVEGEIGEFTDRFIGRRRGRDLGQMPERSIGLELVEEGQEFRPIRNLFAQESVVGAETELKKGEQLTNLNDYKPAKSLTSAKSTVDVDTVPSRWYGQDDWDWDSGESTITTNIQTATNTAGIKHAGPGCNFYILASEEMMTCPYNKSHRILAQKFSGHLLKCCAAHKKECDMKGINLKFGICLYDRSHHVPIEELGEHEFKCGVKLGVIETKVLGHGKIGPQSTAGKPIGAWTGTGAPKPQEQQLKDKEEEADKKDVEELTGMFEQMKLAEKEEKEDKGKGLK